MGNGCWRKGDGAEETGKQIPKFPVSGHVVKNRMTVIFKKDGGLLNLEDPGADILFDLSSFSFDMIFYIIKRRTQYGYF